MEFRTALATLFSLVVILHRSPVSAVNYRLPFPCGGRYVVTQGNYADINGDGEPDAGWDHKGSLTYAFDFVPEIRPAEGAEVRAAASGNVAGREWRHNQGGCGPQFNKFTNFIIIKHADGLETKYLHLQQGSIPEELRKIGAPVKQGEFIGRIGATGWVCGKNPAHLHFQRQQAGKSVPINFFDVKDNCGVPRALATKTYVSRNCRPEHSFHFALDRFEIDGNVNGTQPDGTPELADRFSDKSVLTRDPPPTPSFFWFAQGAAATCEAGRLPTDPEWDGDGFLGLRNLDGFRSSPPFELDEAATGCILSSGKGNANITIAFRAELPENGAGYRSGVGSCLSSGRGASIGIRNVGGVLSVFADTSVRGKVLLRYSLDGRKTWKNFPSVTVDLAPGFAWVQVGQQVNFPQGPE